MTEKIRNPIGKRKKLPQFTIMNVIEGQAGLENYSSLFFYSLTIDNILNMMVVPKDTKAFVLLYIAKLKAKIITPKA